MMALQSFEEWKRKDLRPKKLPLGLKQFWNPEA